MNELFLEAAHCGLHSLGVLKHAFAPFQISEIGLHPTDFDAADIDIERRMAFEVGDLATTPEVSARSSGSTPSCCRR
jgi:hypothetical protein